MAGYIGTQPYTKATRTVHEFTMNSGATTVEVNYVIGQLDAFLNGILLLESDYTANNGTTVVLTNAVSQTGSTLTVVTYNSFQAADHYTKAISDSRYLMSGADGSASNVVTYSSDTTLTDLDVGKSIYTSGAITLTLPTSPVNGYIYRIYGNANVVIVNVSGSATLVYANGAAGTSYTIPANPQAGIILIFDGINWRAETFGNVIVADAVNNNEAVALGQFGSSKSSNGYTKLPNGLILQWGATGPTDIPDTASITVMFPVAFPNACLNTTVISNSRTDYQVSTGRSGSLTPATTTEFTIYNGSGATNGASWSAIGY